MTRVLSAISALIYGTILYRITSLITPVGPYMGVPDKISIIQIVLIVLLLISIMAFIKKWKVIAVINIWIALILLYLLYDDGLFSNQQGYIYDLTPGMQY